MENRRPELSIQDVSYSVPRRTLFNRFSRNFYGGEVVGVFGPNGCGKSTLLYLISGLLKPDSGSVELRNCGERPRTGFLFQAAQESLFPWKSVRENLIFAARMRGGANIEAAVDEIMINWGITDLSARFPPSLSGGEAQKVAIARLLATEPSLILMDEPFAGLDFYTRSNLIQCSRLLLKKEKCIVIIIGHHLDDLVRLVDEVCVLDANAGETRIAGCVKIVRVKDEPVGIETLKAAILSLSRRQAFVCKDLTDYA